MKYIATLFVAFALVGSCLGEEASPVAEPTKSNSDIPNHAENTALVSEKHIDSGADIRNGKADDASEISNDRDDGDDEEFFDDDDNFEDEEWDTGEGNDEDSEYPKDDAVSFAKFAYVRDEIDEFEESEDADTLMGTVRMAGAKADEEDEEVERLTKTPSLRMAALEDVPQEVLVAEDEHDDEMFEIETAYHQMMDDIESDEGSPEEIKKIENSNDDEMQRIKATYRQLIEGGSEMPEDDDFELLEDNFSYKDTDDSKHFDDENADDQNDEDFEGESDNEAEDRVASDSKMVSEVDARSVQKISVEGPEANVLDLKADKFNRGFQMGSLNMMHMVDK